MKKVLVSLEGYVMQVEEPGSDFDIYEGPDATFAWVDAPDDVTLQWTLEYSPSQGKMIWVNRDAPPVDLGMQRRVAYGTVEDQLDMLYHDMKDGNLTSGSWFNHIDIIKKSIPKPPPSEEELSPEEQEALDAIREPDVNSPMKFSTPEMPSWVRCPGWKYYEGDKEKDV